MPTLGEQRTTITGIKYLDYPTDPYTMQSAEDIITGPLTDYIAEASYGLASILHVGTYGWLTINKRIQDYPGAFPLTQPDGVFWYGINNQALLTDLETATAPLFDWHQNRWNIFTINGLGTAGIGSGQLSYFSAHYGIGLPYPTPSPIQGLAHEIGHDLPSPTTWNGHAGTITNNSAQGAWYTQPFPPNLESLTDGGFVYSRYADDWDPLGASPVPPVTTVIGHYDAWHKAQAGWIPSGRIRTVTGAGTHIFSLSDIETQGTTIIDIRIPLTTSYNGWYSLERRGGKVQIRLVAPIPAQPVAGGSDADTFLLRNGSEIAIGETLTDPYRNITIKNASAGPANYSLMKVTLP